VNQVRQLAEQIKEQGLKSAAELHPLLHQAEVIAHDETQDALTRALAHRAAANAQYLLNSFEPALAHYDEAVALLEQIEDPTELARTLHAKVGLLYLLTRFDELFECSSRARSIFEQLGDHGRLARLDVNLAHAFHRLDRHAEALACCERALPILGRLGDEEGMLAALINKAVVLTIFHEFGPATELYRKALALAEAQQKNAWVRLSRYNLAYMQYLNGSAGEALREYSVLRGEFERAGDARHAALCRLDEAEVLLEIGDLDGCILSAREARRSAGELGLNFEIGKTLFFEGAALSRAGRKPEAELLLLDAKRRFESERNTVWTAMLRLQTALFFDGEMRHATLAEAREARRTLYNSGLAHYEAFADIVIGRMERRLGYTDQAVASLQLAVHHAENSKSDWMQFHAYHQLALPLRLKDEAGARVLLYKAEAKLDSLWQGLEHDDLKLAFLSDRENVYTHLVADAIHDEPAHAFALSEKARSRVLRETLIHEGFDSSLESIQKSLTPDETLLEYFVAGDEVLVFAVTQDSLRTVHLGSSAPLNDAWIHLERHFASCSVKWEQLATVHGQLEATAKSHLSVMYEHLIDPVKAEIRSSIIVVPHQFLHGIPFHALYDGRHFLTEHHAVSYSPSAAVYCAPAAHSRYSSPLFVAFSRDARASSIREVEAVATGFKEAEVLLNPSAAALRAALGQPRELIHIAGHAGFDSVGGKLSWIETADGRLDSRDLLDMQINARTVVVTGCQTARREICPGDEWLGLMRALYMSGASAIVSAFWDVRSDCAERFATEFYVHFDGGNASEAVRRASAAIRERRSHPYFWSGFGSFIRRSPHHD
jgi:CHAT domain-containing protein